LLKLGKLEEARTALNEGYSGMVKLAETQSRTNRFNNLDSAIKRLIQLAETEEDDEAVENWKSKLDELADWATSLDVSE
jgi:hypothetical protein